MEMKVEEGKMEEEDLQSVSHKRKTRKRLWRRKRA